MRYYCNYCRKITNSVNVQKVMTSKSSMIRSTCTECGRVKTQFTSNNH